MTSSCEKSQDLPREWNKCVRYEQLSMLLQIFRSANDLFAVYDRKSTPNTRKIASSQLAAGPTIDLLSANIDVAVFDDDDDDDDDDDADDDDDDDDDDADDDDDDDDDDADDDDDDDDDDADDDDDDDDDDADDDDDDDDDDADDDDDDDDDDADDDDEDDSDDGDDDGDDDDSDDDNDGEALLIHSIDPSLCIHKAFVHALGLPWPAHASTGSSD
ncbi:hypothetical protein T265_07389 [Opisthorchis viverrini]|uniref:Uncharacterized protein n=1 Tax=Opisthorchis viverrini TaxID=6198 RepID=A0A074ZD39_OPIVI|nr:hypothetical protein T265_07389 [Opisthorchis viverrini]KER25103.1 hypothetical protein T265_07389 [Opisthorchis viverrini]